MIAGDQRHSMAVSDRIVLGGRAGALRPAHDAQQPLLALAWRAAGVWDRLLEAVNRGYDGDIVMIDSSCVRVHQHGAASKKGDQPILAWDVPVAA